MNKIRREFSRIIYCSPFGVYYLKIVYLSTTPNGSRGKTSSTDTEKLQNTLLERFWEIGTNKVFYWGLFGHHLLGFGEECCPLRQPRPETGESLDFFLIC